MQQPSESLVQLVFVAADHAVECLRNGDALTPFLLTSGKQRKLQRFKTPRLEDGLAMAQKAVSSLAISVKQYAIAYDGYVTIDSLKYDAVLIESAERGSDCGLIFAQRFLPKRGVFRPFRTVGNLALLGNGPQRFIS
jgi:hypothetical protein